MTFNFAVLQQVINEHKATGECADGKCLSCQIKHWVLHNPDVKRYCVNVAEANERRPYAGVLDAMAEGIALGYEVAKIE